ncbi:DUF4148 domain-containing protein [Pandoraea pulmonicola]|uniref:DUF4148 domain-containing protein n=1 Tax=Pandoraea pulmonicola TaxID=93221 RepID=A0AAJ4ZET2_PANPU|nr:DUF4148 domain-containing protein [Pandoraea pulmonicola]AJC19833.1 hypothetical protein RO07_03855 [Pandoraea pulmonicola]SUA91989.1 Uncharacterised protein [Pandoraea pulmonicola]
MQKRLLLSTAIALGVLFSASAQATARYDNNLPMFPGGPSGNRADVQAELNQAHAGGVPVASSLKALQATQSPSRKTREQVRKELEEAAAQGLLDQPDTVYPRLLTD